MTWFFFALAGALAQAVYSAGAKMLLLRVSPARLAGCSFLVTAITLVILSLIRGIPPVCPGFFEAVLVTVAINTVATFLFYRALSSTDLSLCLPLLSFTPVFLILTSFLILGETPTIPGLAGICLITGGSYLLAVAGTSGSAWSPWAPLRMLFSNRGIQFMLIVAFLYSLSVNYDKVVVERSDPFFGSAIVFLLLAGVFLFRTGVEEISGERDSPASPGRKKMELLLLPALGLVLVIEAVTVNIAYTMSLVPYVIAIKRLSIFFGVLIGGYFFGEHAILWRGAGTLVMVTGTILIALYP